MIRIRLTLLALLIAAVPALADDLRTLAGKTINGNLEKISDSEIVVGGVSTPLAQALDLTLRPGRTAPAAEKYMEVTLGDDSLVRCTKIHLGVKETKLELTTGGTLTVPTTAVLTVLRDAQDETLKKQWASLKFTKKRTDRIFVIREGQLNSIEGSFGAIDEAKQSIEFKPATADAPKIQPTIDKLPALAFAVTDAPPQNAMCMVYDMDGNKVIAAKLAYASNSLTVTTPYGQKLSLANASLAKLDFNIGRLTYLSDQEEKMAASAFLGGFNPLRKNLSLDGNPILVGDKQYAKGLSCYAGADFEYNLNAKYKKMSAILTVDLRIAEEGQGKVTVTIYTDKEKRFSQEVSTKAPTPINLDVRDVNTLRIVVAGPNFLPYHGHAVLANAYVSQ
jgi:NPCBM/NEW2 domain